MKRFLVLGSALAFLGFAAPSFAQTPPAPPMQKASDRAFDGRVEEYLPPDQGLSGVLLDTGVVARFPRAKADDLETMAGVGSNVRIVGVARMGPNKKPIVDAQKITNLDNSASMTFAPAAPPPPPPR